MTWPREGSRGVTAIASARGLAHEAAMTRILLFGAGGRMGRAIASVADGRDDVEIVTGDPDVYVDFSAPEALGEHLEAAVSAGKPILIGTTGLRPEHRKAIEQAAARVAVLQAANTSLGVAVL